jgi:DNA excision repair protein ERCC-3
MRILQQFRFNPALTCLFISKVGDSSIDLPQASVLIQISSHYGSRRQEAQRLGRILRAKGTGIVNNAFFYSLVCKDTLEMYYSAKRQQFLVDQGYQFKVITELQGIYQRVYDVGMSGMRDLVYPSLTNQLELLNTVLMANLGDFTEEEEDDDIVVVEDSSDDGESVFVSRAGGLISGFSGADSMAYLEIDRSSKFGREVAGAGRGRRRVRKGS